MSDCCSSKWLLWFVLTIIITYYIFKIILRALSTPYASMSQTNNENFFLNPNSGKKEKFPSMKSASTVYLSVIVPSYFEEKRRKCYPNKYNKITKNLIKNT